MKQRFLMIAVGLLVAVLFVLLMVFYIVREGEIAVVTTFGKIDRSITEAGLYPRWPWPVQNVHRYDGRIRLLSGTFEQALTSDGHDIVVAVYTGWRVADPVKYFERLGSDEQAASSLNALVRNFKSTILGRYPLAALVNVDESLLKFEEIEAAILEASRTEAQERYGIDIAFTGIRKLGLPRDVTEKVYERMRAEREEVAEGYRSDGEGEAIRIKADAESESDQILAAAEAGAIRTRGEGDAAAAQYYKTFEENPELANLLKKLAILEETLKENSTVVLGTSTEPYDLLEGTAPAVAGTNTP